MVVMLLAMTSFLVACGEQRECAECGTEFRGAAFRGVFGQEMRADCAREYWFPLDHTQFRIR